nr:F-box protein SKIP23-like [Ipomoea batatas]
MAEWSELPRELIELIAKRLTSEIDFLRFRSVCSAWRSSLPAIPYNTCPSRFPVIPRDGVIQTTWGFKLSKRPIYLIASPKLHNQSPPSAAWITELYRESPNRVRLLNPLSTAQSSFHSAVNAVCFGPLSTSICDPRNLYMKKVAFCLEKGKAGFRLLTIHISGKLLVYRSGDSKWTVINDSTALL